MKKFCFGSSLVLYVLIIAGNASQKCHTEGHKKKALGAPPNPVVRRALSFYILTHKRYLSTECDYSIILSLQSFQAWH